MAIYMFKGTYTDASIKAMVKKPVDRSNLISKACKAFGGKSYPYTWHLEMMM